MQVLLDTHALIWWLAGDDKLSGPARAVMADESNSILVSAATSWEITTKVRIGKLPNVAPVAGELPIIIAQHGFEELPVTFTDGAHAGLIPGPHRDLFDRMLIAQSQIRGVPLVSNETLFDDYGIRRIW